MGTLLNRLFSRFGTKQKREVILTAGGTHDYDLSGGKVNDVEFTRGLYNNSINSYALAGQLVKPIINSNVHFISEPVITSDNDDVLTLLQNTKKPYEDVHRMAERDADCFVWVQWNNNKKEVDLVIIPPEKVVKTYINPDTKEVTGYLISESIQYNDLDSNTVKTVTIHVTVTPDTVTKVSTDGKYNSTFENPFGFIPIVQFSNGREKSIEMRGHSEIENIETLLKFYHDTMFEAGNSQRRDGHPKMAMTAKDPETWVNNNFGANAWAGMQSGKTKLRIDDRDLYVNGTEDKIDYLTTGSATGDAMPLTERIFTNIVEGSETPEVMFGANLGTSLASVKEQRPVWIRKIKTKQRGYGASWEELLEMVILINNFTNFKQLPVDFKLHWPEPDFKDEKEGAEILETMTDIITILKDNAIISDQEAYKTLRKYEDLYLNPNYDDHEKEVNQTVKNTKKRALEGPPKT
jgi:hypothetical protein